MANTDRKTIMVVDDMATILEHARQILKDDYKVIPCTNVDQAFDIMSKCQPDMILTDINMPGKDGYEFLSLLKSNPDYSDIPVILITAELSAETEAKGFELGADDFILKPFSTITMLKRISNHLK